MTYKKNSKKQRGILKMNLTRYKCKNCQRILPRYSNTRTDKWTCYCGNILVENQKETPTLQKIEPTNTRIKRGSFGL